MLYETMSQPKIFLFLTLWGFASGFLYDISSYIIFLCNKNKIVKIVFNFLATICAFIVFHIAVLKLDYGELRFFHFVSFWLFLTFQRITLGNIIANFIDKCYTFFTKQIQKLLKGLQKKKWKEQQENKHKS
ncbi:MAG: spore cortex biosynthesis protein YabQ [Christensenellales bacterium]